MALGVARPALEVLTRLIGLEHSLETTVFYLARERSVQAADPE